MSGAAYPARIAFRPATGAVVRVVGRIVGRIVGRVEGAGARNAACPATCAILPVAHAALVPVLLLVMGATALPLLAQEVDCTTAEAQVELTFCAEQDWMAADAALNSAYKSVREVMKGIDAGLEAGDRGAEVALRDGQRAWITYRDRTCDAEAWGFHGGSAEPMVIYACRARITAARAGELENMAAAD